MSSKVPSKVPEAKNDLVSVVLIYKDSSEQDTYAQAFGATVYQISESLLIKNATIVKKAEPDIFPIFQDNVSRLSRDILGL